LIIQQIKETTKVLECQIQSIQDQHLEFKSKTDSLENEQDRLKSSSLVLNGHEENLKKLQEQFQEQTEEFYSLNMDLKLVEEQSKVRSANNQVVQKTLNDLKCSITKNKQILIEQKAQLKELLKKEEKLKAKKCDLNMQTNALKNENEFLTENLRRVTDGIFRLNKGH